MPFLMSVLWKKIPTRQGPVWYLPVHSKVLEPKDVQKADGAARILHLLGGGLVNRCVDLVHDPDKEPPVDPLRGRAASLATGPSHTLPGRQA